MWLILLEWFPLYFRFLWRGVKRFRISTLAFPFPAKPMTLASCIFSFCLQFGFGFCTLWEFTEQNSFKFFYLFIFKQMGPVSQMRSGQHLLWQNLPLILLAQGENSYSRRMAWNCVPTVSIGIKLMPRWRHSTVTPLPSSVVLLGPKPDGDQVGEPLPLAFPQPPQVEDKIPSCPFPCRIYPVETVNALTVVWYLYNFV